MHRQAKGSATASGAGSSRSPAWRRQRRSRLSPTARGAGARARTRRPSRPSRRPCRPPATPLRRARRSGRANGLELAGAPLSTAAHRAARPSPHRPGVRGPRPAPTAPSSVRRAHCADLEAPARPPLRPRSSARRVEFEASAAGVQVEPPRVEPARAMVVEPRLEVVVSHREAALPRWTTARRS